MATTDQASLPPRPRATWHLLALGLTCTALAGCSGPSETIDPEVLANYRAQLLLDQEPEGALAVLDVRELFTGPVDQGHDSDGDVHGDLPGEGDAELEFTAEDFEQEATPTPPFSNEPRQVVVVGHVGGIPNPFGDTEPDFPWKEGLSAFFLVDPGTVAELAEAGHTHDDACDCPFCARHAADKITSIAVVNLLDDDGQPLKLPANTLLDVKESETVVIQGTARLMGGELLVIDADGVYVRR